MTEQVSRLVGNLLAGGGRVFLPGWGRSIPSGGLPTDDRQARTDAASLRGVVLHLAGAELSLVDEIARVMREGGKAPEADPQAAARGLRPLARPCTEANLLTVEGVRCIGIQNFTPDKRSSGAEPQGREPVRNARPAPPFRRALWLGVAAIVIALVYTEDGAF